MKCEGWCDGGMHVGEVVTVVVTGFGLRWNYCQSAIAYDRGNGFTVEVVES